MTSRTEERTAEIRRRLADAERAAASRYPRFADAVRQSVGRLSAGLALAHSRGEAVDDERWEGYVVTLDRGLDALDAEMARAAERPTGGPTVADVLAIHATGLELQGWRLQFARFEHATFDLDAVRSSLDAAEAQLDRFRIDCGVGAEPSTAGLENAIMDVREAAGRAA